MQKFRRYLQTILDGKTTLDESPKRWIDYNYYSSVVGGNPNKILINQLLEQRRTGKWADPIQASHPLPPYNEAGELCTYILLQEKLIMYKHLILNTY